MNKRYCRKCHYNEAMPMDNLCEKCFDILWEQGRTSRRHEGFGLGDELGNHVGSNATSGSL